jgi:predicted nucleotidyltransferase
MTRDEILSRLRSKLPEMRRRFAVDDLALFGSTARSQQTPASDIDLFVTFSAPATFDGFMDLKFFLEEVLGSSVDLATRNSLREELRPSIEREAIHVS